MLKGSLIPGPFGSIRYPHGGTGGPTLYLLSGEQGSTLEKGAAGSPKHLGCGSSSWVRGIWAGLVPALSATGCSREGFLGEEERPSRAWVLDLQAHYGRLGAGNCSDTVKLHSEGLTPTAPEELAVGRPVPGCQAQHGPLCALGHVLAPLWTLRGLVNYFQASFQPRWSAIQVLDAAVSKIGRCS